MGLGLVALLVGCEAAARLEDLVRWGVPLTAPATTRADIVLRGPDGMHGRPDTQLQGWHLNSHGTRGPEFEVPKPAGTWRLVVVGASELFGLTETPGQEFARQLEDSLRAGCPGARLEVVNAALPGMTLPTVAQDLARRIPRFEPDLVLYGTTPAQYLADAVPTPAAPTAEPQGLSPWRSRAWPRFVSGLREVVPGPMRAWARDRAWEGAAEGREPGWRFAAVPHDRLATFEADLRRLVGAARATGAGVLLMPHVHAIRDPDTPEDASRLAEWRRFAPRATSQVLLAFDSTAAGAARRVAADSATLWVDVRPVLQFDAAAHFADFAHLSDLGAARLASVVRAALPPVPGC